MLRQAADPAHLDELSYEQAVLPCSRGGVQLACADAICEAAFLAGVTSSLSYVAEHAAAYCLADANLSDTSALPLFLELHAAHARWSSDSADSQTTLSHLLAGSPRKQNVLCGGLWDRRQAALLGRLDACGRARLLSAAGQWAGQWLEAMPTHHRLRAPARLYSLALAMRLGVAIPDLPGAVCRACGTELHDVWGRHPSQCSKGNKGAAWDLRHLSLQDALLWVLRTVARISSAQVAKGNVIGSAACTEHVLADGTRAYKRLDLWVPGYLAPGRPLGIDVAVTDPLASGALRSSPSSSAESGRAATLRADRKVAKYEHILAGCRRHLPAGRGGALRGRWG